MNILEFFYENPPQVKDFVPRKVQLSKSNILLYGPSQSGKTYLAIDYLRSLDMKFLYLDLNDLRIKRNNLLQLEKFIQNEKIEVLCIDNYDESIILPVNTKQNILITRRNVDLMGYKKQLLYSFDFEEFLGTSLKTAPQTFNSYLKEGVLDNSVQTTVKANLQGNTLHLFCYLCSLCAKNISINQIYLNLKKEIKISKDWLYKTIQELEQDHYIFFLSKHDSNAAAKKLFITHQPFINAVTLNVGFIYSFINLVINELVKKGYEIKYEQSGAYIVDNKKLITLEPFGSEEAVWVKIQKRFGNYKKIGIRSITSITVSMSFEFEIESIKCEAIPFYEWAVLDEF